MPGLKVFFKCDNHRAKPDFEGCVPNIKIYLFNRFSL